MKNKNTGNLVAWSIESLYESFTSTEKRIADFFLRNTQKGDFSAKELSRQLYVSPATLSRFAVKCGYKGYREFIYHYEEFLTGAVTAQSQKEATLLVYYREMLDQFPETLDMSAVRRVVQYINESKRVYVIGKGESGFTATEMEWYYLRLGVDITAVTDPDKMKIHSVFFNSSNLVIAISVSGKSAEVMFSLREAHKNGARTVLITANSTADFSDCCDEVLLVPKVRGGNAISSRITILLLVDYLYRVYFETDRETKRSYQEQTVRSVMRKGEKTL